MSILQSKSWSEGFSFLRVLKMEGVFLLLYALAQSVGDFRKLHSLLPDNCQMLRGDLLALIENWKLFHDGNSPEGGKRISDAHAQEMMAYLCPEHGMTGRYVQLLDEGKEAESRFINMDVEIIFSHQDRPGHGSEHFNALVGGIGTKLGCFLSPDETTVAVRFIVHSCNLSESSTHTLREQFASSLRGVDGGFHSRMGSTSYGQQVDFWYEMPEDGLVSMLEMLENKNSRKDRTLVATPDFIAELLNRLHALGLDIPEINPIIPVPKPGPEPMVVGQEYPFTDLDIGDKFEWRGTQCIKVSPFSRGNSTFHAISLDDGDPMFTNELGLNVTLIQKTKATEG
ncbi:hypothetical protein KKG41_02045 [Patescibacteria group bacterium]|nr:hypothetical protein [Patescibacteria group bacterium]MBU1890513.1 hypothetical protein [Patescibacteria group bacterium]